MQLFGLTDPEFDNAIQQQIYTAYCWDGKEAEAFYPFKKLTNKNTPICRTRWYLHKFALRKWGSMTSLILLEFIAMHQLKCYGYLSWMGNRQKGNTYAQRVDFPTFSTKNKNNKLLSIKK